MKRKTFIGTLIGLVLAPFLPKATVTKVLPQFSVVLDSESFPFGECRTLMHIFRVSGEEVPKHVATQLLDEVAMTTESNGQFHIRRTDGSTVTFN